MRWQKLALAVVASHVVGIAALHAGEAGPPAPAGAPAVLRPADNPLVKPGGAIAVPTITWEKVTVRQDHPRLLITKETRGALAERMGQSYSRIQEQFRTAVLQNDPLACALMYQFTGQDAFARTAIRELLEGRVTSHIAYVFDWTYEAMTEDERRDAIDRVWATAAVDRASGWLRCSAYVGYPEDPLPSETPPAKWPRFYNWTFNDQDWSQRYLQTFEAIVALAGHKPRAAEAARHYWEYSLKDAVLFLDYLRDGSYWQGYYWSITEKIGCIYRLLAIMKSACGVDYLDPKEHPYLANVGRWLLYGADIAQKRIIYNYGDGEMVNFDSTRVYIPLVISAGLAKDSQVEWLARQIQPEGSLWFVEFFFHDRTVPAIGPSSLPPSRAFTGTEMVVMRSGWGGTDPWASVRWCDWFDMHGHPDMGSFTLYCRGPVAPDTGFYDRGIYHGYNYYTRTVAHNTITVRDPAAKEPLNDGCQRKRDKRTWSFALGTDAWLYHQNEFDRGKLLAFETQGLYDYCAGDGTRAYRPELVKEFVRQVVFLRDGVFITFDRVEAPRAGLEKRWLMHFVGEPDVDGKVVATQVKGHIEDYDGSLSISRGKNGAVVRCHSLLPAQRIIRKIGGAIPDVPVATLCRVPRGTQRMGTGSRWEWTDPLIFYYNDPLTGKKLPALCFERDTPTEVECEVNENELYLKLHAYERGRTDELRLKLADYPNLLELTRDLGQRLKWHTAVHYLPGYEYYNEGANYAPAYGPGQWEKPQVLAPELLGGPNDAGAWRIEVYPAKSAARDCFLNVVRMMSDDQDAPGEVALVRDADDKAEAKVTLKDKTYNITFNKTGDVGGHIRITDAAGKALADRDFTKTVDQKD